MSHTPPTGDNPPRPAVAHPTELTGSGRDAISARLGGVCICHDPIETGQVIVKRWGQWIHFDCYQAVKAAKRGPPPRG